MDARHNIKAAPDVTTEEKLRQLMKENGEKLRLDHNQLIESIDKQNAQLRDTLDKLRESNARLRAQGARTDEAIAIVRDVNAKLRAAVQRLRRVEGDG